MATPALPNSTPQAFASYLNTYFSGDNGKKGGTVANLNEPGSTLGAQWLSWYNSEHAAKGSSYTLIQYEQAFILLWEDYTLGNNLGQATTTGLGAAGTSVQGAVTGLDNFYNSSLFGGLTSLVSNLENANLWLRIGEGLLGVILIAVGVARMTNAVGAATKIASVVK